MKHQHFVALACASLLAGCSLDRYQRSADEDAYRILDEKTQSTIGNRWRDVVQPERQAPPEPTAPTDTQPEGSSAPAGEGAPSPSAAASPEAEVLSLAQALELAIQGNREFISAKESLYLAALSLFGTRHSYSPLLTSTLSYLFGGGDHAPDTHGAVFSMGLSQLLASGGSVSVNGSTAFSSTDASGALEQNTFSSAVGISLTQPLLRGRGRDVAWESLIQAERSLMYAVRQFEQFRESFSIDVARRFYGLVQNKQSLDNQRVSLDGIVFGRRQAEAFFSVGKGTEIDVLRARQNELSALNSLNEAEVDLQLSLDNFRIFLGLDEGRRVDVIPNEPKFIDVDYDVESSVQAALKNRLDFLTAQDQLEDARRGVRIAENGVLPDLNFSAGYNVASRTSPHFFDQGLEQGSGIYSAGLTLDLPVDQTSERASLRSTQISYAQSLRSFAETRDRLIVGVQSSFRGLERRKQSLEIQRQLIKDAERSKRKSEIEFERGRLTNRELLESQRALLNAQNALIDEKVNYETTRLELLRDLGILFIDEHGMWKE